jgi:choline monooxygenase
MSTVQSAGSSQPLDVPAEDAILGSAITAAGLAADGPVRIPVTRYTSTAFAELERERVWPRTWQIACSVDHVAEPGDWFEYRCGPFSVLIVRGEDGALRAFQNACRHRGNQLCTGSGQGLTELRCPYHRWAWDLEGRLREVPSRKGFGPLRNEDFPLLPARAESWARFVFVTLDVDAPPLLDYLEGVPEDIAWARLDEVRCVATTVTPVPANWKVVVEGFSETYHVQGLHREMLGSMNDVDSPQRLWDHHGVSYQPYGVPSPRLGRSVPDDVVWESFLLTQGERMGPDYPLGCPPPAVPEHSSLQHEIAERIRRHQGAQGADMGGFDDDHILGLRQYNLFPNATLLVTADLCTVLAGRPGATPDQSELFTMHFRRASAGAPRSTPFDAEVPMDQARFGFVLDADFRVLPTMQAGLRQPGLTHIVLSREECRVINLHRNLSRYTGEDTA